MRLRLVRRGPAAAALALLTLLYATVHSCAASAVVAQALRAARLARTAHPPALTHTADAARVVWDEGGDPVPLLPALGFQLNDATAVFKVAVGFDGVDRPDEDLAVLVPPPAVPRGFVSVHRAVLNGRPVVVFTAGLRGVRYTRHIVAALRAVHVDFSKAQQARGKRRVFVSVTTDVGVVQSLDVPWYKGVVAVVRHASTPMVSPTSATARVGERAGPFTVIPSSSDDPGETTHVIVTHTSQGASVIDAATGLVVPTGSALPCDVEHAAQVYLAPPPGRQCFSAVACFAASDDGARPSQASRVVNVSSVWLPPPFYGVPDVNFQVRVVVVVLLLLLLLLLLHVAGCSFTLCVYLPHLSRLQLTQLAPPRQHPRGLSLTPPDRRRRRPLRRYDGGQGRSPPPSPHLLLLHRLSPRTPPSKTWPCPSLQIGCSPTWACTRGGSRWRATPPSRL